MKRIREVTTYQLSERAKRVTWNEWKKMGGCGMSSMTVHAINRALNTTESQFGKIELGKFQEVTPIAGRELARFGLENLKLKDWAVVEFRAGDEF